MEASLLTPLAQTTPTIPGLFWPVCDTFDVMNRERALDILRQLRRPLEARGIAHAAIFGSVARDEAGARSDIDVVVTPHHGRRLDLIDLGGVQSLLDESFGGIDVDVVGRAGEEA